MNLNMPPVGVSGRYRMVVSSDAEMRDVTEDFEFDNLITDTGLDWWGQYITPNNSDAWQRFSGICGRFVVGSGSSQPEFTDTALDAPVAFATGNATVVSETSSYSDGYCEIVVRWQFGQGVAEGNLSEIGIQRGSVSGGLWSRALILDGLGNPTTITVRDTDFLTCFYTLRVSIPQTDSVFNILVDYGDEGQVPTTVTMRPLNANNSSAQGGWALFTRGTIGNSARLRAYTGGLALPTAISPLGTQLPLALTPPVTAVPYVGGSHEAEITYHLALGDLNSNNLATLATSALMGEWQVNFNPPLQKNNTQTMDLTFGYSWARA